MPSSEVQSPVERNADTATPQRRRRKRTILIPFFLLLLVGGVVFGIYLYHNMITYEDTDDATIEGHIVPMSPRVAGTVARVLITDNQEVKPGDLLVELDPRDFQNAAAQGKAALESARAQEQQARVGLELTSVTSSAGVSQATYGVERGQSSVSAAQAQLGAAQSQVRQAEASLSAARAALQQSEAEVAEQRAIAERATNDRVRYEQLFKEGVVAAQQRDLYATTAIQENASLQAKQKNADAARAQVNQAQAMLAAAQDAQKTAQAQVQQAQAASGEASGKLQEVNVTPQRMATSQSQLEAAQAEARRLEAMFKQAELNLSYTRITAPVGGRITRKSVEPGQYVQVGQPLFSIVPGEVWVVANFKETQLTHMRPGQPVTIEVDAYPDRRFRGHIDSIQRGTGARFSLFPPENATGNFIKVVQRVPVKIVFDELPDNAHLLAPGMSVVPKVRIR